jgi:NAD(P)-dependent dehydrogenase (short-subunit alcohol dehydrogenase family)
MDMPNKIALVTAAASGAGRAGALILAREGAAVAVVDQNEAGATGRSRWRAICARMVFRARSSPPR